MEEGKIVKLTETLNAEYFTTSVKIYNDNIYTGFSITLDKMLIEQILKHDPYKK